MERREEFSVLVRAGVIGSIAVTALSTPLDVARRSAQAALAPRKPMAGLGEALRAASKPSVAGLFRGIVSGIGQAAVAPVIFLVVYEQQKAEREAVEAGLVARAAATVVAQPLEFLRTSRQGGALLPASAGAHLERSAWELMCADGIKSFWRGGIATVLRDVSACGLLWTSYVAAQRSIRAPDSSTPLPAIQCAGLASACAAAAAVATQPFDVIKTRMQVHQLVRSGNDGYRKVKVPRFFATASSIHKAAGIAGLWAGWLPRAVCAGAGGLLLGPLFEFCQVLADDADRPVRKAFVLPPDTTNRIIHPRSQKSMFIDVKGGT